MPRYHNIVGMQVNKTRCKTCPFNENGCLSIRHEVEKRVLFGEDCKGGGSQMCHGTNDTTLCRGARDHQITIFHRLGILKEPTDACWEATQKEADDGKEKDTTRPKTRKTSRRATHPDLDVT